MWYLYRNNIKEVMTHDYCSDLHEGMEDIDSD